MNVGILSYSSICKRKFLPALNQIDSIDSICVGTSKEIDNYDNIEFVSYDDFFKKNFDWVYISSIPSENYNFTKKCLMNGWHVLCEKHAFIANHNFSDIMDISKSNKLLFFENYSHLFHVRYNYLKKLLDKNIDKISFCDFNFFYPGPNDKNNFRYNANMGGGVQYDSFGYLLTSFFYLFDIGSDSFDYNVRYTRKNNVINLLNVEFKIDDRLFILSTGIDIQYDASLNFYGDNIKFTLPRAFSIDKDKQAKIILEEGFDSKTILLQADNQFLNVINYFIANITSPNSVFKKQNELLKLRTNFLIDFYAKLK